MGLKSYKPYTKSTRTTVLVDRKDIWKGWKDSQIPLPSINDNNPSYDILRTWYDLPSYLGNRYDY